MQEPAGALVAVSECKHWADSGFDQGSDQDRLEWSYDGIGTLLVRHVNTAFNCCPEYDIALAVRQRSLTISEDEIAGACDCTCVFDVELRVTDLPCGIYAITVEQEYLEPGEPTHAYELDLTTAGSGSFCISRSHYPWTVN